MFENDQAEILTYIFTSRDFKNMFGHFSTIYMKGLKINPLGNNPTKWSPKTPTALLINNYHAQVQHQHFLFLNRTYEPLLLTHALKIFH